MSEVLQVEAAAASPKSSTSLLRNVRWLVSYQSARWIIGFLMGAWVARVLGPEDFGVLATAAAASALAWCGMELGMKQIIIVELSRRKRIAALVAGTAAKLWMASGVVFSLLAGVWNASGEGAPRVPWWVFWATMTPLLLMFFQIHNYWEEASQRSFVAARNRMAGYLAAAVVRLGCLIGLPTVTAFAWTNASEHVVSGGLGAVFGARRGRSVWLRGWHWKIAKSFLLRGGAVIVGQFGMLTLLRVDTMMLEDMRGMTEAGIYGAAVRLSEMAYLIAPMIITLMLPAIAAAVKSGNGRVVELEGRASDLITAVGAASVVGLLAGGPLAIRWLFGPEFMRSEAVLLVHCLSVVPLFMMEWRTAMLIVMDRLGMSAALSWGAALLNLLLNALWIPEHGALGAAWATVVSYVLGGVLGTWLLPGCRWMAWSQVRSLAAPFRWIAFPRREWSRVSRDAQ